MGSASKKTFLPLDPVSFTDESKTVIDFIADYYENIENYPVQSTVEPGYLSARLPDSAPYCPEPLEDILKDVSDCIIPGLTHWQSPNFFAYFQANASTAGFLGEMLCSGFNVEPNLLTDSLSSDPEILRNKASRSKEVVDYKDWQIALSRRFRALKLWIVIRRHGLANLMYHIRSDIAMAKRFEAFVRKDERFEMVVPRKFALVCFRLKPKAEEEDEGTELNRKLVEAINSSGKAFMSHAVAGGIYVIRCAIGTTLTQQHHVDDLWKLRRNNYSQGNRKLNGKAFRAQRDDSIRGTLYVSDIDQNITEEQLAGLFSNCGQKRAALNLGGTMLGFYPVKVLPSKTAILPVNPTFLPRVSQAEVKNFIESACGEVTCLRLLGDSLHSTRIAFVEFAMIFGFRFLLLLARETNNRLI
ncbi:hypothetical protein V6N11_074025 [Hibiscus sabdariffa]|uniref:Uncharacterized protein n=1 Tax=Hibiscus sabdariffa TaxID=183260 RepID=A0ABR2P5B7_9ROSI